MHYRDVVLTIDRLMILQYAPYVGGKTGNRFFFFFKTKNHIYFISSSINSIFFDRVKCPRIEMSTFLDEGKQERSVLFPRLEKSIFLSKGISRGQKSYLKIFELKISI